MLTFSDEAAKKRAKPIEESLVDLYPEPEDT